MAAALAGWLDFQRQHKVDPAFLEPFFTVERYGQALRLAISDSTLRNASLLDFIPRSLATLMAPWWAGDRIRWDGGDERMFIRALCDGSSDPGICREGRVPKAYGIHTFSPLFRVQQARNECVESCANG